MDREYSQQAGGESIQSSMADRNLWELVETFDANGRKGTVKEHVLFIAHQHPGGVQLNYQSLMGVCIVCF